MIQKFNQQELSSFQYYFNELMDYIEEYFSKIIIHKNDMQILECNYYSLHWLPVPEYNPDSLFNKIEIKACIDNFIEINYYNEDCGCQECEDGKNSYNHSYKLPFAFFEDRQAYFQKLDDEYLKLKKQKDELEKAKKATEDEKNKKTKEKQEENEYQTYLKLHEKYKNKKGD